MTTQPAISYEYEIWVPAADGSAEANVYQLKIRHMPVAGTEVLFGEAKLGVDTFSIFKVEHYLTPDEESYVGIIDARNTYGHAEVSSLHEALKALGAKAHSLMSIA